MWFAKNLATYRALVFVVKASLEAIVMEFMLARLDGYRCLANEPIVTNGTDLIELQR